MNRMKTRKELAKVLRKRQLKLLPVTGSQLGITKEKIKKLSDDQIIESYITCNRCGKKLATIEDADRVLEANPKTFDEFWDLLESLVRLREMARKGILKFKKQDPKQRKKDKKG